MESNKVYITWKNLYTWKCNVLFLLLNAGASFFHRIGLFFNAMPETLWTWRVHFMNKMYRVHIGALKNIPAKNGTMPSLSLIESWQTSIHITEAATHIIHCVRLVVVYIDTRWLRDAELYLRESNFKPLCECGENIARNICLKQKNEKMLGRTRSFGVRRHFSNCQNRCCHCPNKASY